MYQLELHCHTKEVSACSTCPAAVQIARYQAAGYQGLVSTNHINRATFRAMENRSWAEKVAHFMRGFRLLQEAAGDDFDVLLGCEINLTPVGWPTYIPNDYLVYGVTEDWLLDAGDVRDLTLEALSEKTHAAGLLLVHAHPFRHGTVMMNEALLDGIEVYNGNIRQNSHNQLAEYWADLNGKIKTSGSDFHWPDDPCLGGIATSERIRDNQTLLRALRGGQYTLLRGEAAGR